MAVGFSSIMTCMTWKKKVLCTPRTRPVARPTSDWLVSDQSHRDKEKEETGTYYELRERRVHMERPSWNRVQSVPISFGKLWVAPQKKRRRWAAVAVSSSDEF